MGVYAKDTKVSSEKSRMEIESILDRYGANKFAYIRDEQVAGIAFEMKGWRIRFKLPMPDKGNFKFTETTRRVRSPQSQNEAYEQAVRQRWRALTLVIKAKLESVESGIETLEQAFMPHILLPGGETVTEWMVPQMKVAYATGNMPPLLGSGS